tara:strand:- start:43 stop:669 length:627 start_codon:yes stop_codon:yes gene_type:complete
MSVIIPLFPSILYTTNIETDCTEIYDDMISSCNFIKTHSTYLDSTLISNRHRVLEKYPQLKQRLFEEFYYFKNEVMRWHNTDFQIVTSWLTKTEKGQTSQMHCHKNSFYSGVLYFDTIENVAPIEFYDLSVNSRSWSINDVPLEEINALNAESWQLSPGKNDLIFFPSHLYHRIKNHQSDQTRYSLAFNIIPVGIIGKSDSQVNFNVK